MARSLVGDVLLALHSASADAGFASGQAISDELTASGRVVGPSRLLACLLQLETSGHVLVARGEAYRFSLTDAGQHAALDMAGARTVDTTVVFVDLVGFVAFTSTHGDDAAHQASLDLRSASDRALASVGGRVVKSTGDGVLAALPCSADPVAVLRAVAAAGPTADDHPWPIRAAAHAGTPIEHRGDLFGHDVNLTARLCDAAEPDQLVITAHTTSAATASSSPPEALVVRGLADAVHVLRVPLR